MDLFLPFYCTIKHPSCNGLLEISGGWGGIYVCGEMSEFAKCLVTRDDTSDFSGVWRFRELLSFRIYKGIEPALKIGMLPVLKAAYTNAGKTTPDGAWKINQISELPALIKKINMQTAQSI
jgi:hypothetical protein